MNKLNKLKKSGRHLIFYKKESDLGSLVKALIMKTVPKMNFFANVAADNFFVSNVTG